MKLRMAIWRTNLRIPTCPLPRLSYWQVLVTYLLVWAKLSFLRGLNPWFSYASLFRVADVSVQSYTKARDTKTCPEITWVLYIPSCHHCLSKSIPPSFCSSGSIFPAKTVTLFLPTGPWTWEVQSVPVTWDSFCVSWQEYIYFGPGMLTMQSPELQKWKYKAPSISLEVTRGASPATRAMYPSRVDRALYIWVSDLMHIMDASWGWHYSFREFSPSWWFRYAFWRPFLEGLSGQ